MSLYRTLLEDDTINALDNDNDGYEEARDLMDVIDDEEINAQEIEDAQEAEFGPDDIDDIMDETAMIIAESEMAWNAIMESIGIRELNEAVNGINEAESDAKSAKEFFNGAKANAGELFGKLMNTTRKWKDTALAALNFNAKFLAKHREDIIEGSKAGGSISGYPYTGMNAAVKFINNNGLAATKAYKIAMGGSTAGVSYTSADRVADMNKVISKLAGGQDMSHGEFKKAMLATIRGGSSPTDISMKGSDVVAILSDKDSLSNAVDSMSNQTKAEFKSLAKAIAKLERSYGKAARGADDKYGKASNKDSKATAVTVQKALKDCTNLSAMARSVVMKCITERARQARKLANIYIKNAKGKGKGAIKESFEYGYLSDLDLI